MTWTTSSAPTSPILSGMYPIDGRDAWSEHEPSAQKENEYIRQHDYSEYARCHLGIDDEHDEDTKGRYKFPYGDFEQVHRCGLLAAESRAGHQDCLSVPAGTWHVSFVPPHLWKTLFT